MQFIKEFKEFAIKGNVIDLAIAVVLGASFNKIVTALTDSILMPLISLVVSKQGMSQLKFALGNTVFPYGILLQSVLDFILTALVLFLIVRVMNRMKREKEAVAPAPPQYTLTEKLLMEIRDSVKK